MRIVIPYDSDYFSRQEIDFLQILRLTPADVVNMVLFNWPVFTGNNTENQFELVVDETHEWLHVNFSAEEEGLREQAELILAERIGDLLDIICSTAQRLHFNLKELPDEIMNQTRDEGDDEYTYIHVKELQPQDQFAVLETNVRSVFRNGESALGAL